MKASIGNFSHLLIASAVLASTPVMHAQASGSPPDGSSPQTQHPIATAPISDGSGVPCPTSTCATGHMTVSSGKHMTPPRPKTEAELERRAEEGRIIGVIAEADAEERMAKSYEDKGDLAMAAVWRGRLAKRSGLTPEEAEIVKKIGTQYLLDQKALSDKIMAANRAVVASHHGVAEVAAYKAAVLQREQYHQDWYPKVKSDLLAALGSRSYTRLDSYALHMDENVRPLQQQKALSAPTTEGERP